MLATLERIDPHSDRIEMLVALVEELRPPRRKAAAGHAAAAVPQLTPVTV